MKERYSAQDARRITGVSQRRLDYWDERGLVRPSVEKADGKGTVRTYSYHDLVKLSVVKHLRDSGLSLQRIQKAVKVLRNRMKSGDPLKNLRLVTDGKHVHTLTENSKALEDVLGHGQLVFSVVAVGKIELEVRKAVSKRARRVG